MKSILFVCLWSVAGGVLAAASASAQVPRPAIPGTRAPLLGVGYVADAPQILAGVAVWGLIPGLRGFGLYLDAKLDLSNPSDRPEYEPGLTATQVQDSLGHEEFESEDSWNTFNVAVLHPITSEMIGYVGAGYARRTRYREYLDPDFGLGNYGYYWVDDPAGSGHSVNVLAGLLLRISRRFRVQFGAETKPAGFTFGVSAIYPGR